MIMKSTELRIGNLVQFPSGSIYKVDMLYQDYESLKVWKPISLTEEWLLRFGFEKNEELNFINFSFTVHFWSNYNSYMYGWIGGNIELKHVHQLQNLYFALTGDELEINLNNNL